MLHLAVTKKGYRNSKAEGHRLRRCPHRGGALKVGLHAVQRPQQGCPATKQAWAQQEETTSREADVSWKKPTPTQAWKVAASGQSVCEVPGYPVKNNLQEARGDVLGIQRNFPNSHELYGRNTRDTCNLFHPMHPCINTSQKELENNCFEE